MKPVHRLAIVGTLGASVLLALLLEPPQPLVGWLPDRLWQVTTLAFGIFLGLLALLVILGVVPLRLTLFGSRVELLPDSASPALAPRLTRLENETDKFAARVRRTRILVRRLSAPVVDLERRVDALERGGRYPSREGAT